MFGVFCFSIYYITDLYVARCSKDISKLLVPDSTVEHMTTAVPLSSIYIARPDDMPCIEDWTTCAVSYLFNGCRLHREPLDLNYNKSLALTDGDHAVKEQFTVKKGFTRLPLVTSN